MEASSMIRNRVQGMRLLSPSLLRAHPENWRRHPNSQREALRGVLASIGIAGALLVRPLPDGLYQILDGHLRAEELAGTDLPCVVIDVTDAEADALLATHDVLTKMAETEENTLQVLIERTLRDADEQLREALIAVAKFEGVTIGNQSPLMDAPDLADVPPVPEDPITRPGDVWIMGAHRLICGDSTSGEVIDRVTLGEPIAAVWTDPPYGVEYGEKNRHLNNITRPNSDKKYGGNSIETKLDSDGPDQTEDLLRAFFAALYPRMAPAAPFYLAHPAGEQGRIFMQAIKESGLLLHQVLIWLKDSMVLGRSDYHYEHEPVAYGWKPDIEEDALDYDEGHAAILYGWKRQARFKRPWYAGRKETSVFQTDRPKASTVHPTMKPVALIEWNLRNSTKPGDMVFDGFAGSGSTLIACERLGRRFRGVEIDPGYCDVIVTRWQDLTGQEAYRSQ